MAHGRLVMTQWKQIAQTSQHALVLIVLCLIGLAWSLSFPCHPDIQWLTHEAALWFHGGHYMTHFIDPNPPLIMLVYEPINILARFIPLPLHTITIVYLYAWIILSVLRCRSIFLKTESSLPSLTLVFIAIMLAIFPMSNGGQRESLMLVFSMPYLLSCLTKDKQAPKHHGWDIAFACLGFLLKIQYILIPLCIEAYLYLSKKKKRHTYLVFIATTAIYIVAIYLVTPRYWTDILPMIKHYYAGSYGHITARDFYLLPSTITFCLGFIASLVAVLLNRKHSENHVLLIAFGAALLNYLAPQQLFLYHRMPVDTYWLGLSLLLAYQLLSEKNVWHKRTALSFAILVNSFLVVTLLVADIINTHSQTEYYKEYKHFMLPKTVKRIYPLLITATRSELSTLQQGRINCSRMESLWLLMYFDHKTALSPRDVAMKKQIQQWVIHDIEQCQPQALLIENETIFKHFTLEFFKDNPRFNEIWNRYHYHHSNGHIDVFLRKPTGTR